MSIKHAAWPTGVPPVTTARWGQEDWNRFAEGFRPKWYKGPIFDYEAYEKARAAWEEGYRRELLAGFGVTVEDEPEAT